MQTFWTKRKLEPVNLGETTNLVFEDELLEEFDSVLQQQIQLTQVMIDDPNAALIEKKLNEWHLKLTGLLLFI